MMPENPNRPAIVELHIEELVLHGFPTTHRYDIGDVVERELHRLLSEHRLPVSAGRSVNVEFLDGGVLRVAKNARAQAIGAQLAQQLHQQLATVQKPVSSQRHVDVTRPAPGGAGRK